MRTRPGFRLDSQGVSLSIEVSSAFRGGPNDVGAVLEERDGVETLVRVTDRLIYHATRPAPRRLRWP